MEETHWQGLWEGRNLYSSLSPPASRLGKGTRSWLKASDLVNHTYVMKLPKNREDRVQRSSGWWTSGDLGRGTPLERAWKFPATCISPISLRYLGCSTELKCNISPVFGCFMFHLANDANDYITVAFKVVVWNNRWTYTLEILQKHTCEK